MGALYVHYRILTEPLGWASLAERMVRARTQAESQGIRLYGIWRSQIGRPRDELNVLTTVEGFEAPETFAVWLRGQSRLRALDYRLMRPTLRPSDDAPPTRQGNYAWRFFETPAVNWEEFLALCTEAWPGFESAYDSQIIGLWRFESTPEEDAGTVKSLLMTRRPDLAMWERSKLPQGAEEAEVRAKLSRRYDLCDSTQVHTSTLLTAVDTVDTARWT